MLFNSYTFIFFFLIPVLALFFILKPVYRLGFLVIASFIFYLQWSVIHLVLLAISIVFNYFFSKMLIQNQYKYLILIIAIILNLLPLIYFKYSLFLHLSTDSIVLPLAISFYTFQQITYLVDLYRGKIIRGTFSEYIFFVIFFPQLVAGPIVHYSQIMSQVNQGVLQRVKWDFIHTGVVLFSIGIFKKVVLADQFFSISNGTFEHINTLSLLSSWIGLFAYSFGIYFDFSGYTDMAIGLGLLFGLQLPINFDSPYKAHNIVDFWRRWHITLSNFLKEYIYIPLGGNRKGKSSMMFNLIITMTLGGLWHGAGWTFVLWGFLHGVLLAIIHIKNSFLSVWKIPRIIGIFMTFLTVSLLWVLFRSHTIEEAMDYYAVLFSFRPEGSLDINLLWVTIGFSIVWILPNSTEFINYQMKMKPLKWYHAFVAASLGFLALKMMAESPAQTFVYFNF